MATATTHRIARLRNLIEHPRTGAAERAAAQRLLDRITTHTRETITVGDRSYGARHDRPGRHASLARIAEMISEDIALARLLTGDTGLDDEVSGDAEYVAGEQTVGEMVLPDVLRDAPASIRFTVETPYDAGIVIVVDAVPSHWGWHDGLETPALRALSAALVELMNAYNHDGSDISRRFVGSVKVSTAGR
ncbi:hypothetical protein [Nocardia sp. NBC_00511]|uniref:hypothetical protein n=1 Tax=Nocardia sp. NBC_00511 TaxID=2903591 RepID=UPI0030E4187B